MKVNGQAAVQDVFPTYIGDGCPRCQNQKSYENLNVVNNPELKEEAVAQAVNIANEALKITNYHLEIVMEENNTRYQVKVVDSDTGEVIREIPPDYMMKFTEKVKDCVHDALGIILDELV